MAFVIDTEKLIQEGKRRGATFLALFGSHARGDQKPESDVDILARFAERKSLLDLVAIESAFTESIGQKVDLVTEASLSTQLRESIERDLVVLLDREE
jgi:predicted nucleotidyltransferase